MPKTSRAATSPAKSRMGGGTTAGRSSNPNPTKAGAKARVKAAPKRSAAVELVNQPETKKLRCEIKIGEVLECTPCETKSQQDAQPSLNFN